MYRPLIMGNWKMNNTLAESLELIRQLAVQLPAQEKVEVVVCPPFTSLDTVGRNLPAGVLLGAQNVHPSPQGAFTGEISVGMLKDLGCRYIIVGHSERRHTLGESDEFIAGKVAAALAAGLIPVLCVGETLEQRQLGIGADVVKRQLQKGLSGIGNGAGELVVAYEPVWAIGTGQAATLHQAEEMLGTIKEVLANYPGRIAGARLLYGGSVTPANMAEYAGSEIIDGALVGGASLQADQFAALVRVAGEVKNA